MKNVRRILAVTIICVLVLFAFTACHSHAPEWRIDKENHWKECSCGEISEKGKHTFDLEKCTVCGAERKTEDGVISEIAVFNEYGDRTQLLYFDEDENPAGEASAEYTYDENGNKLTHIFYEDGALVSSGEYAYDDDGFTYLKYETEAGEDGTRCVYEYNEVGDSIGYIIYDEEGNKLEDYRSEYITDEKGDLVGEKVYVDNVLSKEIKYAEGSDGEEDYLYIEEEATYSEDGSKKVNIYSEDGDIIRELSYDAGGNKIYEYDLEYFYDDDGNQILTEKREDGVLKQKVTYEYDEDGYLLSEKTYEGDRLIKESQYTAMENYAYESKIITYNEDGTTTVSEYDENGESIG